MKKIVTLFFIFTLISEIAFASQIKDVPRILIEIREGQPEDATLIAIDRIREYSAPSITNVVAIPASKAQRDRYDLTIVLGTGEDSPELQHEWQDHPSAKKDSWVLHTISKDPLVILASGENKRGLLYAAYHLADLLKAKSGISNLDLFFQPRVKLRYVTTAATTYSRRYYQPGLFYQSLKELPRYGYNGILVYPGAGTPIAKHSSPVPDTKAGKLYMDPGNTKKWKEWFSEIDKYQFDIMMTLSPLVPPGYSKNEINDFYKGGPEPKGYISSLKDHFKHYLELIKQNYPEIDRYLFNSTEGATYGRNKRFFGHPGQDRETYLANNEKIMKAYLDVLKDVFGSDLHKVGFWTHSFGITSIGIKKMRKILFQYPEILILEDDYWNNNLWPMEIPPMKYLPPDLRAKIATKNPFGMYQIATDGEYYGGGSLPNAYPGSHIRSAKDAVKRNALMVIQRIDLHARTPYGTLFGTTEIIPFAASKQLWSPTPSEPEIWKMWAKRRFGKKAAPFIINALQESKSILLNGLSCNGMDLLCVGSEFKPALWAYGRRRLSRFYLFSKPNKPMLEKTYDDTIYSGEYTVFQMNTHTIPIKEYLKNQNSALQSIHYALDEIEKAKPYLSQKDYRMIKRIFVKGETVIKALKLLGKAAYAGNIMLSNYDNIEDPSALFKKAVLNLESFIHESKKEHKLIPPMNRNLTKILNNYKKIATVKDDK